MPNKVLEKDFITSAGLTTMATAQLCTEVELTLSARNLRNMDVFSKSDPMVVIYFRNYSTGQWQIIGRTEVIMNNLNPDFAMKVMN